MLSGTFKSVIAIGAFSTMGFCVGGVGLAQQTTVQLPTFNFSTVNTTVNVPDGGTAVLGGINRHSQGSTERGLPILSKVPFANRLFKNRAIGQEVSASQMRVTSKIVILEELEQEVMDQAAQSRAARGDRRTFEQLAADYHAERMQRQLLQQQRQAEYLSRQVVQNQRQRRPSLILKQQQVLPPTQIEVPDVEAIRRQNELARQQRNAEAVEYFEQAQTAMAAGKHGVARIYGKMAARRAHGQLKQQVEALLQQLDTSSPK